MELSYCQFLLRLLVHVFLFKKSQLLLVDTLLYRMNEFFSS